MNKFIFFWFSSLCETWRRIRSGSEDQIRIGIKSMMPVHKIASNEIWYIPVMHAIVTGAVLPIVTLRAISAFRTKKFRHYSEVLSAKVPVPTVSSLALFCVGVIFCIILNKAITSRCNYSIVNEIEPFYLFLTVLLFTYRYQANTGKIRRCHLFFPVVDFCKCLNFDQTLWFKL